MATSPSPQALAHHLRATCSNVLNEGLTQAEQQIRVALSLAGNVDAEPPIKNARAFIGAAYYALWNEADLELAKWALQRALEAVEPIQDPNAD